MERQCRICLDTENSETMITPCMCRGTSAYIHEACFQQYLEYYPDRICRVCHYRIPGPRSFPLDTAVLFCMVVWMITLLLLSPVADHYKLLYFLMMLGALGFGVMANVFRGVFGVAMLILSFFFTFLDPILAVQCTIFFGFIAMIGVMILYISPEVMLMLVTILLVGSYSIIIVSFFALKQDAYLTAFMVPFMLILWACVIRARPPLRP